MGLAAQTKPLARGADGGPPLIERWEPSFYERALFAPIAGAARRFRDLDRWPRLDELNRELGALVAPYQFVPMPDRRTNRTSYDASIVRDGAIRTREANWHDFLNALVWATFPKTKAALHARQYDERLAHGPGGNRSRASDRLTCFDEGGIFVESELPVDAMVYRSELEERGDRIGIFGHAIYEHVLRSAHVTQGAALVVRRSNDLDGTLARVLAADAVPDFGRVRLAD